MKFTAFMHHASCFIDKSWNCTKRQKLYKKVGNIYCIAVKAIIINMPAVDVWRSLAIVRLEEFKVTYDWRRGLMPKWICRIWRMIVSQWMRFWSLHPSHWHFIRARPGGGRWDDNKWFTISSSSTILSHGPCPTFHLQTNEWPALYNSEFSCLCKGSIRERNVVVGVQTHRWSWSILRSAGEKDSQTQFEFIRSYGCPTGRYNEHHCASHGHRLWDSLCIDPKYYLWNLCTTWI
jgi:hypothetical protein